MISNLHYPSAAIQEENKDKNMDVGLAKCSHCEKDVPSSNLHLHSLHCERMLKRCSICKEMIPKRTAEQDYQETHGPISCSLCGEVMERNILNLHGEEQCTKRMVACRYCEFPLPLVDLKSHVDVCANRTQYCHPCGRYVRNSELFAHVHGDDENDDMEIGNDEIATTDAPRTETSDERNYIPSEYDSGGEDDGDGVGVTREERNSIQSGYDSAAEDDGVTGEERSSIQPEYDNGAEDDGVIIQESTNGCYTGDGFGVDDEDDHSSNANQMVTGADGENGSPIDVRDGFGSSPNQMDGAAPDSASGSQDRGNNVLRKGFITCTIVGGLAALHLKKILRYDFII